MKRIIYIFTIFLFFSVELLANEIKVLSEDSYLIGYRIRVDANIIDKGKILQARVYFKSSQSKDYQVYAPMKCIGSSCRAILPIPIGKNRAIDYKIIYINSNEKIYSTNSLMLRAKEMIALQNNQKKDTKALILKTDSKRVPKSIKGFRDNFVIKTIKKSKRIGVLAGLISAKKAGVSSLVTGIDGTFRGDTAPAIPVAILGGIMMLLILL